MREILGYFINPEASMSELVLRENKNKWKEGLKYLVMIIILLGFLTVATCRIYGTHVADTVGYALASRINSLVSSNLNEGFAWVIVAIISIVQTFTVSIIRFLAWTGILYLVSLLLENRSSLYEISIINIFSLIVWVAAQVLSIFIMMIVSIIPIQVINEILVGISILLSYWYLILIAIGFTLATKSDFYRAGIVILGIQSIFWMLGNKITILQVILG